MAQQVFFLRSDLAKAIPVSKQRAYQIAERLTPAARTPGGRPLFDVAQVEALRRRRERRPARTRPAA